MNAPVVYLVRFWIKPGREAEVLDWLDGGHIADVVGQPGFRWARRFELVEPDPEGWSAHAMIYGVDSMQALESYFHGDAAARYAAEREERGLDDVLKMDRNWGTTALSVDG